MNTYCFLERVTRNDSAERIVAKNTEKNMDTNASRPYGWIINPFIDLLFCCGGMVWILFAIHYFVLGPGTTNIQVQTLLTIAALGTIFLGETHTIASLVRLYGEKKFASGYSFYRHLIPLALSALALAACSNRELPPILAKIYLLIVSQHFTKQTYGIVLLYCMKRQYKMGTWDKRILANLMHATMIFAIIRQLTYKNWSGEEFLGQKIPFWGPLPEWVYLLCCAWLICASSLMVARIAIRCSKKELFPLPALLLAVTGVLIFVLDARYTGTLWIYAPAFFHGSQYLTVSTSVYLKSQGLLENLPSNKIYTLLLEKKARHYMGFLVLAGIAVFIGIPHILQQFGFSYVMAVTAIFTTVQFHHVLVDHVIWRMKDTSTRELLSV
ncbi:MAG TPA: hypothetical protein PKZ32_02075 [Candidatus Melainabacteria bacterium]|nr:hypothetical protein [Candidatus Melainabacteria bacterium]